MIYLAHTWWQCDAQNMHSIGRPILYMCSRAVWHKLAADTAVCRCRCIPTSCLTSSAIVCRRLPLSAIVQCYLRLLLSGAVCWCRCLPIQLSDIVWYWLPLSATICLCSLPSADAAVWRCLHMPLSTSPAVCHCLPLSAAACHYCLRWVLACCCLTLSCAAQSAVYRYCCLNAVFA